MDQSNLHGRLRPAADPPAQAAWGKALNTVVESEITGFHQDAEGHWVADLSCGHEGAVRHDPPFNPREWVLTEEGRSERVGTLLRCPVCALAGRPQASVVAEVAVESGMSAGQVFTITDFPAVIGRGSDADVCLDDDPKEPTLSRHHVRLSLSHGHVAVRDISTNGTRLQQRSLKPEDLIAVGDGTRFWLGPKTSVLITEQRKGVVHDSFESPLLQVNLLGAFQAEVMGIPIPDDAWQSRKAVELLALLAEAPMATVPASRLQQLLWPEAPPPTSDAASCRPAEHFPDEFLESTLGRLRRHLRAVPGGEDLPDPVVRQHDDIHLAWGVKTDSMPFESRAAEGLQQMGAATAAPHASQQSALRVLEQAADLYSGPFLDGWYGDWVEARRATLQALALQVLEAVASVSEQDGRWHESLHWRNRYLAMAPTHEPSHMAVIFALLKLGHRDEAHKHCVKTVQAMHDAALEPSEAMLALQQDLARPAPPAEVHSDATNKL